MVVTVAHVVIVLTVVTVPLSTTCVVRDLCSVESNPGGLCRVDRILFWYSIVTPFYVIRARTHRAHADRFV